MGVAAAILGLALLVLIHEAGHFFAARAVGMTPRKFYLGFGPPIARKARGMVEYGIGSIPLGGYVKIPGMNRPSPGDLRRLLDPLLAQRHSPEIESFDAALQRGDFDRARELIEQLRPALGETRGFQEIEWSLAPDAYWRQATWRRLVAIGAGPAVNLVFAFVIFTAVFVVGSEQATSVIGRVLPGSPAAVGGLHANDRVLSIAGHTVTAKHIPTEIRATGGRPFRIVVERRRKRTVVGPLTARETDGVYKIGIALKGRTGPGDSLPVAAGKSVSVSWEVVADSVRGLAHIATGRDTNQVSSPVGIVRTSTQAWRDSLRDFLFVLGLISLALGFLNLLPVLPLDGGHIVIALVEKVRGRTFSQAVYLRYSVVGLTIFAILFYFGLRNDLFGSGGG